MQGRNNLGGGAKIEDVIKGIYEEYKVASGGNVCVGDFVNILTDYSETDEIKDTAIRASVNSTNTGKKFSAVALNSSKVFIAHSYGSNYHLYGIVCTINGTTITVGTDTVLNTTNNTGKVISAVKLDEGKVFIAHPQTTSYYLMGTLCEVSNTSITVLKSQSLLGYNNTGQSISVIALNKNKVFIAHSHNGTNSNVFVLYGIVCTISGTEITKGSDTQLSTITNGYSLSVIKLTENKVFIASALYSDYPLYGLVCLISGTAITSGTNTRLLNENYSGEANSAVALSETKVLIAHRNYNNNKSFLNSLLCDINGVNITSGTDIKLTSTEYTGDVILAVKLDEGKVFIAHNHGSSYYLYGLIQDYFLNLAKTITLSTEKIGGVAITSGQPGEMITTVRPDDILKMKLNATISTENYGSITWENEVVTIRKHNTDNTYYTYKTINIEGINYNFSFALFYGEGTTTDKGTRISCIFSPNLYTDSTRFSGSVNWVSTFENSTNRSTDLYTEPNKLGEKITINASVEKIN